MKLLELLAEAKRIGDPQPLIDAVPYARFMGITIESDDSGVLRGTMKFSPMLVGNPSLPALHGGTLGALLESTAIFQLMWDAEAAVIPRTINITVDYLRSAKPVDTFARGIVTRHGRRVANVRSEAWQDDPARPIAISHGHFLLDTVDPDQRVAAQKNAR